MTDKLAPSADRLAFISLDLSAVPKSERLALFVERTRTVGPMIRDGLLNDVDAVNRTLWDIAQAHGPAGLPGSETEEHIAGEIEAAIAIDDEPRAMNGHDVDRWSPDTEPAIIKPLETINP